MNIPVLSENWMLDEVIKTCNEYCNEKEYYDIKDRAVKILTIQKIEYGRICIAQLLAKGGQTLQTMNGYYNKLDAELQKKIIEIGGIPRENQIPK